MGKCILGLSGDPVCPYGDLGVDVTGTGATLDYEEVWGKFGLSYTRNGAVFTLHPSERETRTF